MYFAAAHRIMGCMQTGRDHIHLSSFEDEYGGLAVRPQVERVSIYLLVSISSQLLPERSYRLQHFNQTFWPSIFRHVHSMYFKNPASMDLSALAATSVLLPTPIRHTYDVEMTSRHAAKSLALVWTLSGGYCCSMTF